MADMSGQVALVTGGTRGLGLAICQRLIDRGVTVAAGYSANAEAARQFHDKYADHGVTVHQGDVGSADDCARVIGEVLDQHGQLDILVNNAGIAISASVIEMSLSDWRRQTGVNLDGVFLGVKHSIPLMRATGDGGSIINMSSVAGLKGSATLGGYCATKGGVRLFTKAVAMECANAKDGIRVNSVHPGIIETPIWLSIVNPQNPGANAPPDLDAMSTMAVPLGVKGVPLDIANGVLWLASDESRYVTGAELVIDGGLSVR